MKTINCLQFRNLTNLAIAISVYAKRCLLSLLLNYVIYKNNTENTVAEI